MGSVIAITRAHLRGAWRTGTKNKRARARALRLAAVLAFYVGEVPGKPLACAVVLAGAGSLGYDRNLFNRLRQTEFCVDLSNSGVDARSTTFAGIGIHEDCSWDG
ncbi:hypothetical protein ADE_02090 [Achromobacter denitrificans]|nr:hypothetical protein ADE_02090 [Achromobacter denitrificans]